MIYGKESLTLDEVHAALMSKELNKRSEMASDEQSDGLFVRGRSEKRETKYREYLAQDQGLR